MNAVLTLDRVTREYRTPARTHRVLDAVSLAVAPGELLAVTGPSGSGKSTLLNLCALLDRPDAGRVRLAGRDTASLTERERARLRGREVGIVLQSCALLPYRSVLENVLFRYRYVGAEDPDGGRDRARRLLEELGIGELASQSVRWLSGGEMQRVAIARAVVRAPRLLVADEPTGNLDRASAAVVMECFRRLNRERGIAILLATHDLSLIEPGDRHLRCRSGELEEAA
jgi:ABC-type lipoprotein export system ATPase subunit